MSSLQPRLNSIMQVRDSPYPGPPLVFALPSAPSDMLLTYGHQQAQHPVGFFSPLPLIHVRGQCREGPACRPTAGAVILYPVWRKCWQVGFRNTRLPGNCLFTQSLTFPRCLLFPQRCKNHRSPQNSPRLHTPPILQMGKRRRIPTPQTLERTSPRRRVARFSKKNAGFQLNLSFAYTENLFFFFFFSFKYLPCNTITLRMYSLFI